MVGSEHKGIIVATKGLTFSVKSSKSGDVKTILNNVNFIAKPGQLFVIMGPSGSGKTTFLNAISGRLRQKTNTQLEGEIFYNGSTDTKILRQETNYVMQTDSLMEFLTVRETLFYSSLLRLPDMPRAERQTCVDRITKELGLMECLDVYIGGANRKGISGGQKKRVSIAIEMMDDPELLFLDEPTSGLDSSLAYDTMKVLVNVAKTGRTVISTVHQPRSQTFALFDQLLLLTSGRVVYQGSAKKTQEYFASMGHPCPPQFNAADFYLDLISPENAILPANDMVLVDVPSEKAPDSTPAKSSQLLRTRSSFVMDGRVVVSLTELQMFPDAFKASDMGHELDAAVEREVERSGTMFDELKRQKMFVRGSDIMRWFKLFSALTSRSFLNSYRNPLASVVQFVVQILYGLIIGGIFFQLARNGDTYAVTRSHANDIIAAIFLIVEQYAFSNFDSLFSFPQELSTFNRDAAIQLYPPSVFFLAKMTADFLFQHVAVVVFSLIAYIMCGLGMRLDQLFFYLLTGVVCTFSSASYLYMVGTAISDIQASSIVAPIGGTFAVLLSGFFLRDDAIPKWISWARYINYLRFAFFALLQNEFRLDGTMGTGEGLIANEYTLMNIARIPLKLSMWVNLIICFALGVGYRFLAFLFVKYLHRGVGLEA